MLRLTTLSRVAVLLLAGLLSAPPLAAMGQHHKREAREEIDLLENQWRRAQLDDDVAAMDKLLSDDYLGITAGGEVVTKAQQLDRMRSRQLVLTKLAISDVKIKIIGQIAIVNSLAMIEGSSDARPLNGSFRYTRVYQRLPGGIWKITSFEPTRITGRGNQARQAALRNDTNSPQQ